MLFHKGTGLTLEASSCGSEWNYKAFLLEKSIQVVTRTSEALDHWHVASRLQGTMQQYPKEGGF